MKIAIASGKGGTGKTTVCASLVHVWPTPVMAVDLDVEEPNLHLFLQPVLESTEEVSIDIPIVDESRCDFCRKCAEICQFKAITVFGDIVLTYPEMCHGCGGCMAVCPQKAFSSGKRPLGEILHGKAAAVDFWMGRLRVGEAMSPPLMRLVKQRIEQAAQWKSAPESPLGSDRRPAVEIPDVLIDAPPGVSCPAMNAVMGADVIVLVTEPTPFGLYDLKLAHEAFQRLHVPMGVVINRSDIGTLDTRTFCREVGLDIWAEIPFERGIAEAYAAGRIVAAADPKHFDRFRRLAETLIDIGSGRNRPQRVNHA